MTDQPRGSQGVPTFSPQNLMALYLRGQSIELAEVFLAILRYFRETSYHTLDAQGQRFVNDFVKHFLSLFTQPDFIHSQAQQLEFVRLNATISNVVSLSSFGTTDSFLAMLGPGQADTAKLLTLCSARNTLAPDRGSAFDADPLLASEWFSAYAETYRAGLIDPTVWENLKAHFAFVDDRLAVSPTRMTAYFAATYVGGGRDKTARSVLNRIVREAALGWPKITNRPNPRSVAIFSGNWSPKHSVYRITRAYVEALRGPYHLTFFPLSHRLDIDTQLFDDVRPLSFDAEGQPDLSPLLDNDFAVAYYPDVGLTPQSIVLSNLRIAPVQVASMGHSVSTWGAEIDYFVSGSAVEPVHAPECNYSERLVMLPGCGAVHEPPAYSLKGRKGTGYKDEIVVNCPWNAQKLNYPFGLTLRELTLAAQRPVRFRLFVGASLNKRNDYLSFLRGLRRLLGKASVEVVGELTYNDYMALMEEGDFCLDSYPFGGCNTVADSLFLRKLTVCREGDIWYNRIGPAMLRMVGLSELVASSEEDYLAIALRLIADDPFRTELQKRLDQADLDTTIFERSEARSFLKAIDFLIANHDQLRISSDRSPIWIGC